MGQVPCGAKQGYGSDTLASAIRVCTSAGKVTTASHSVETGCTPNVYSRAWERVEAPKANVEEAGTGKGGKVVPQTPDQGSRIIQGHRPLTQTQEGP